MSDKSSLVQWKDAQPVAPDGRPRIEILKIVPHWELVGFILSDKVVAVPTHWIYGRTRGCLGFENGCDGCRLGLGIREKGYLAVHAAGYANVHLLELTPKAMEQEPALCVNSGLRGVYFTATRAGETTQSRLVVKLRPSMKPTKPLPPAVDVKEVLCRIWFGGFKKGTTKGETL